MFPSKLAKSSFQQLLPMQSHGIGQRDQVGVDGLLVLPSNSWFPANAQSFSRYTLLQLPIAPIVICKA